MELLGIILLILAIGTLAVVALYAEWKVFKSAGKPGWACIIPFYNSWVLAQIGSKPAWFGLVASLLEISFRTSNSTSVSATTRIIMTLLTVAGFAFNVVICNGVAKNFGRSTAFGLLLAFLPLIGFPLMAFGKRPLQYNPVQAN